MSIETIFTVKNEHLNQLDQNTAVEFFQKLLGQKRGDLE